MSSPKHRRSKTPGRARRPDPDQDRSNQAAYLSYLGMIQDAIAKELSVSTPTVRRLHDQGRESGILVPRTPWFRMDKKNSRGWGRLGCPHLSHPVQLRLAAHGVERVQVFPADEDDPGETRARLARAAALLLYQVLEEAIEVAARERRRVPIGFTAGPVWQRAIEAIEPPPAVLDDLVLVALSGDPSILPGEDGHDRAIQSSANRTVAALGDRLELASVQTLRFSLPDRWPVALLQQGAPLALLRVIAAQDPVVSAILGSRNGHEGDAAPSPGRSANGAGEPLLERMTAVCAELVPPADGTDRGEIDPDWVAGRVNGHLLPTRASGQAGRRACELQNQLAPGASPHDLCRVADRVRPHYIDGRGVVLLASGKRSVEGILVLTAARAVNELVMASDTAQALLQVLDGRLQQKV
jgi:DNA-binding transcriptional regulator LsrR (DeoR family)